MDVLFAQQTPAPTSPRRPRSREGSSDGNNAILSVGAAVGARVPIVTVDAQEASSDSHALRCRDGQETWTVVRARKSASSFRPCLVVDIYLRSQDALFGCLLHRHTGSGVGGGRCAPQSDSGDDATIQTAIRSLDSAHPERSQINTVRTLFRGVAAGES